jgi:aspartyl-tRNA(Asn)/glutamyl-tRNA(Gln) amidotransferase subunit C
MRREEIEHIAALARLDLDPQALPALTEQIGRILDYVSRLPAVDGRDRDGVPWLEGAGRPPLRPDAVRPPDLVQPSGTGAPAYAEGFFLVPRLAAMDE